MRHSTLFILLGLAAVLGGVPMLLAPSAAQAEATHFPKEIARSCRGGRAKLYDECGSQVALLNDAIAAAEAQGKVVLVVSGAEWCIWCHAFAQTIDGQTGLREVYHKGETIPIIDPPESKPELAGDLAAYVGETFVVFHSETDFSADGYDVLDLTQAPPFMGVPYVFTLKQGKFAAALRWEEDLKGIEVRSEPPNLYRGFDRAVLMAELQRMAKAAR